MGRRRYRGVYRLRRLADEIQRTSRRVNALEHILLPQLVARRNAIHLVLEEREREDLFCLKRIKHTLRRTEGRIGGKSEGAAGS